MSNYQVLARKWRPHNFESIVGQDTVVQALTRALTENRLHHAYLFTGTRGVGKTTIARIFAKALNCQGVDGKSGITARPCGQCPNCRAIDEGCFPDYVEMDAASNRSVDDIDSLLELSMYAPTQGRFKIYMIDEVHMLSQTAFNAMLKTLEEPPEFVKFILATTDPQKIPITVLSRCLQFNLRNMTPASIVAHMRHILTEEKIAYERPALQLLANGARGSMRDGLSLLDQAIAYCRHGVQESAVRQMLGMSGTRLLEEIWQAILLGQADRMLQVADEMQAQSLSFRQVLRDMIGLIHMVALVQRVPQVVGSDHPYSKLIHQLAQRCKPEEIQLYYQILLHGRNELSLAPDEYAGFTMALLRILAFKPSNHKKSSVGVRGRPQQSRPAPVAPAFVANVTSSTTVGAPETVQSVGQSSGLPPLEAAPRQMSALGDGSDRLPPWGE